MVRLVAYFVLLGFALLSRVAHTADGVIEINQAAALAGQVTSGDSPGYPVTLSQRGSYKLTSELIVPADTNGIELGAQPIQLDLNGFGIRGPASCIPISCPSGSAVGISSPNFLLGGGRVTVVNGYITGFNGDCIRLSGSAYLERLDISVCGGDGIELLGSSIVLSNRVNNTGGSGMILNGSIFRDNYIFSNGLIAGTGGISVKDGKATGGNYCGDGRCTPRGERRYYQTQTVHMGSSATSACAFGFHMASLYEIFNTSVLTYDGQLGATEPGFETDGGVPRAIDGWIRTGQGVSGFGSPGTANCLGWTSSDNAVFGSLAAPNTDWNNLNTDPMSPWRGTYRSCGVPSHVWCVED